jgi:hypothetical protein
MGPEDPLLPSQARATVLHAEPDETLASRFLKENLILSSHPHLRIGFSLQLCYVTFLMSPIRVFLTAEHSYISLALLKSCMCVDLSGRN